MIEQRRKELNDKWFSGKANPNASDVSRRKFGEP